MRHLTSPSFELVDQKTYVTCPILVLVIIFINYYHFSNLIINLWSCYYFY